MPLAKDHSCSECTKPYKPLPGEDKEIAKDAMPVKMIVMDGIVMGPVVTLIIHFQTYIHIQCFSTVHLETALMTCSMPVVVPSVQFMKQSMGQNVVWWTVKTIG